MKRYHLFLFSISFGVIVATFLITGLFWDSLPNSIPTHFGISGLPDAWTDKNLFYGFFVPIISLFIFLLFAILYRYPQYTNIPQTMVLMALEENHKKQLFEILRNMNSSLILIITGFFSYVQFSIIATANERVAGVNSFAMLTFLGVLIAVIIHFYIKYFVAIKKILKSQKRAL